MRSAQTMPIIVHSPAENPPLIVRETTNKTPGPGIIPRIKMVDASNSDASKVILTANNLHNQLRLIASATTELEIIN